MNLISESALQKKLERQGDSGFYGKSSTGQWWRAQARSNSWRSILGSIGDGYDSSRTHGGKGWNDCFEIEELKRPRRRSCYGRWCYRTRTGRTKRRVRWMMYKKVGTPCGRQRSSSLAGSWTIRTKKANGCSGWGGTGSRVPMIHGNRSRGCPEALSWETRKRNGE